MDIDEVNACLVMEAIQCEDYEAMGDMVGDDGGHNGMSFKFQVQV